MSIWGKADEILLQSLQHLSEVLEQTLQGVI